MFEFYSKLCVNTVDVIDCYHYYYYFRKVQSTYVVPGYVSSPGTGGAATDRSHHVSNEVGIHMVEKTEMIDDDDAI